MKILFLTYYFEPDLCAGSFRNTSLFKELLNQLTDNDFVHVITTQPHRYKSFQAEGKEIETGTNFRIDRIKIPLHKSGFSEQIKSFYVFYRETLELVKKQDYDLVYAPSSRLFTAFLGRRIAAHKSLPLYLDIRDIFVDTMKDLFKNKKYLQYPFELFFKRREHYTFSKAKHINLVSEGFRNYFEKYRFPSYSYYTNGIDDLFLNRSWEGKINENRERKVVLYAGNIGQGQGLEKIIPQAAQLLADTFVFKIVGDGGTKALLKSELQEFGVTNVELCDPVSRDRLMEYYQEADYLFLHLNDYDAFKKVLPSKIFEYAVFNKPIIAGVSGYAQQFIRENVEDCILFYPTDVRAMVEQLKVYKQHDIDRSDFIQKFSRRNIMRKMAEDIIQIGKNNG